MGDLVAVAAVLALELLDLLGGAGDVAVELEQVDVEEDDAGEQHADQDDPAAAGEQRVERLGAAARTRGRTAR